MWLIGCVGLPYYLITIALISFIAKESDWAFLLMLPALYFYDYFSQKLFRFIVCNKGLKKSKYCVISLMYQCFFIVIILGINWIFKT